MGIWSELWDEIDWFGLFKIGKRSNMASIRLILFIELTVT
jgi:hypothetical protein